MAALHLQGLRSALFGPIDLAIGAGELVLLSGPSGAGKSLLLRGIADLDPSRGEVSIDAVARSQIPPSTWRRRVGLLPAEPGWWADRVGAHLPSEHLGDGHLADANPVATVANGFARPTTLALLAQLGFGPEVLDWEIARLSTGERQRLALARMLLMQPEVLLLDEPTANLDPDNRARVEALLGRYRDEHQAAVLWVSHDPEQRARLGGRDLHIAAGRLTPTPSSTGDTWN